MLKYSIWASHLKLLWWSLLIWTVPWEKSCISYLIQPLRGKHHSSRKLANLCNKSPILLPLLQTAGWKDISSGFTIKSQSLKEELEVCYHMFSATILTCGLASRNSPFYPLGKALPHGPHSWFIFDSDPNVPFPAYLMTRQNRCYLWESSPP